MAEIERKKCLLRYREILAYSHPPCLSLLSVSMIKYHDQNNVERKGFIPPAAYIMKGSQDRNPSREHREMWLIDLLGLHSYTLRHLHRDGTAHIHITHQSRKCPHSHVSMPV